MDRIDPNPDDDDAAWATGAELAVAVLATAAVVGFAFWPLLRPLLWR